jgi:hypothetical protein
MKRGVCEEALSASSVFVFFGHLRFCDEHDDQDFIHSESEAAARLLTPEKNKQR